MGTDETSRLENQYPAFVGEVAEELQGWDFQFDSARLREGRADFLAIRDDIALVFEFKFVPDSFVEESVVRAASRANELRRLAPTARYVRAVLVLIADELTGPQGEEYDASRLARRLTSKSGYDAVVVSGPNPHPWTKAIAVRGPRLQESDRGQPFRTAIRVVVATIVGQSKLVDDTSLRGNDDGGVAIDQRVGGPLRYLLVSDEWSSGSGGISSFNRELAAALSAAGQEVCVYVPSASDDEIREASSIGVDLAVPSSTVPGLVGAAGLLAHQIRHLSKDRYRPDIVVGHGRVLGPHAYFVQGIWGEPRPKRVHFVHTYPELLELAKEGDTGEPRTRLAGDRRRLELDLARSADVVAGVGPLLSDWIRDDLGAEGSRIPVVQMDPGLKDWGTARNPSLVPTQREFLLVGRAEDFGLKGVELAIRAVGAAKAARPNITGAIQLAVRGVPTVHAELRSRVDQIANEVGLQVILREYSTELMDLKSDLRKAIAVLMPSRHEGFGLAAYEAIAMGTPVVISKESGLSRFLTDLAHQHRISSPPPTATAFGPQSLDQWASAIVAILDDPEGALHSASILRTDLNGLDLWADSVSQMETALSSST